MPVNDVGYEAAERRDARWLQSINTAKGYFYKTGSLPSIEQMEYWFRGGKKYPKLPRHYLEEALGIAAEEVGVNLAYRYTLVGRVENNVRATRKKYQIEWTLMYYAPYKVPFNRAIYRERKAAKEVLIDLAWERGSAVSDAATFPDGSAERVPTGVVRKIATLTITDNTRKIYNEAGEMTGYYKKVFSIENKDVLQRIKDLQSEGLLV